MSIYLAAFGLRVRGAGRSIVEELSGFAGARVERDVEEGSGWSVVQLWVGPVVSFAPAGAKRRVFVVYWVQ